MTIRVRTMIQVLLLVGLSAAAATPAVASDPCPYCTANYHTCISRGGTVPDCEAQQVACMEQYCGFGFTRPTLLMDKKDKYLVSPSAADSLVASVVLKPQKPLAMAPDR
jgi:hypothetical protein